VERAPGLEPARVARVGSWLDKLVSDGKLPGASVAVQQRGELVFAKYAGYADVERRVPMTADTIVRIKSMTKPMTSVAALILYEEGRFQLDDPISRFLPECAGLRVYAGGPKGQPTTVPAERDISIRDLLTHTSGLTYGFLHRSVVDEMYRDAGVDFQLDSPLRDGPPRGTLAEMAARTAAMPLLFQPGSAWNYSVSTDLLGHLVAVVSGQEFPEFMRTKIFEPLGMHDTSFCVPPRKIPRFAAHYAPGAEGLRLIDDPQTSRFTSMPTLCSAGGGAVSTAGDYLKFCQMVLQKGELNGVRLLGRHTVDLMTRNHLTGDIASLGCARLDGETYEGVGFGLGFSVLISPQRAQILGTEGQIGWWGSASTCFWIDPAEELAVVFLTQLTPSSSYPLRRELKTLVYQALA
jgi:CubicO group peptidase (beta-lactamase class C family)